MIADPRLLKPNGGFDFVDVDTDTSYRLISDHDGTIKENIFDYAFTGTDVNTVGKHDVFCSGDELTLDMVSGPNTIFAGTGDTPPIFDLAIDSSFPYVVTDNSIVLDITSGNSGFLKITVAAGEFFNVAQRKERPVLEFVIHPQ